MKYLNTFQQSSPLARRMVIYVVLASTFITIFTSIFQLYEIYKVDVSGIEVRMKEVRNSYSKNIATRLWVSNQKELDITLQGILSLPAIEYIEVYEEKERVAQQGVLSKTDTIEHEFPLFYTFRNEERKIGHIRIVASLADTYRHLYDQALAIIISNGVKTFLISGFMLYLFYTLVARHLISLGSFAKKIKIDSLDNELELNRNLKPGQTDEIDTLANALVRLQTRLKNTISEIHEKQITLANSEAKFRGVLESAVDGILIINEKGKITLVNKSICDLTGYSSSELIGSTIEKLVPEKYSNHKKYREEYLKNPSSRNMGKGEIFEARKKDGTNFSVEISLSPVQTADGKMITVMLQDVTARHKIEKEREVLSSIMDAVITIDEESTILSFNKVAEKLFNYDADEIIGTSLLCLIPEKYKIKHKQGLEHYLKTDDARVIGFDGGIELEGMKKGNIVFPLRLSIGELPKSSKGKRRFIGVCQDLTQLKQQEEQLRRSQKMEAMGKLTGGIAHDYNNMLGVVLGYAEMLDGMLKDKPELQKFVNEITHAGERGVKLTKKLLTFSRQKTSDSEILNINDILKEQQDMLAKTLTARIKLVFDLSDEKCMVNLDNAEFEDAIINMSINAMHAIEDSGSLTIQTRIETLFPFEAASLNIEAGDYVALNISDTGKGMDEITKEKLFEPFFTTKGDLGTGLGLSQVYGFIDRCNGTIKVYSELGLGTRLILLFPRCSVNEEDHQDTKDDTNLISDLNGSETILVVDDEAGLRELTSKILLQNGYKVLCAESGKQALDILKNESVDLVFSDVIMPEMDGFHLAEEININYPLIKIQLASGFSDGRHEVVGDIALYDNLLNKPYSSKVLLKRVRELLDAV